MRKLLLFLLVLMATPAVVFSQIDGPAESEPYKLIRHTLATQIPDGAYLADGGWEIIGASASVTADVEDVGNKVIWTGTPGVYQLVFDGIMLKDVTFTDGAGNEITIKSYIGRVKSRATCKIEGSTPGPDPPDPPTPGGKYQLVFWYTEQQLDNLPQGQRDILTSLVFRDWLRSQGHVLVEVLDPANFGAVVPDKWKPWVNSILNQPLPRISLSPVEGGQVTSYQLPADMEACKKLLAAPGRKR